MPSADPGLISHVEAALLLGISPEAVPRLIASGDPPTVRVVGLSRSIFESSLEALIRRMNQVRPGPRG
jgi:hypothetical protein